MPYTEKFTQAYARLAECKTDDEIRKKFVEEMIALGPLERIKNLYRIKGKLEGEFSFLALNSEQEEFLLTRMGRDEILKSRQIGFCLDPKTRVLTADLTWVPIGELVEGQEIIGVDEKPMHGQGSGRRMRASIVQAVARVQRMAYRITFDDGREVICTDKHPWLSKTKTVKQPKWRSISGSGNVVVGELIVGSQVRWITKPWGDSSLEDYWFGGVLDGEGSIALKNKAAGLCVSQRHGPVWDRLETYAKSRGYNYRIEADDKKPARPSKFGITPVPKVCFGRMNEIFKLIGQTRPTRFIKNRFWENRELPGKKTSIGWATIVSIEPLIEQTMIDLQTSTGTYIAEGFVSHNTTLMCVYAYDRALWDGWTTGIMSHLKEKTQKIFDIVHNCNDWFKKDWGHLHAPEEESSSANTIAWKESKASIIVAYDFQSLTVKFLHISEAAFIDENRISNSLQSVPENGEVCLESTANGRGGFFYDQWQNWRKMGSNAPYKGFFFPWYNHYPEDKEKWQKIGEEAKVKLTEREEELSQLYNITLANICWRRWKIVGDFKGDEEKFENQYPSDDTSCFFSGENAVFPPFVMKYQESFVKDPSFTGEFDVKESNVEFRSASKGMWKIWELPNVSKTYVMGVDCSEGIGKDAGVLSLWDRNTGYQVAQLIAQLAPEELASEAWKSGHFYKYAWICPEVNNHGHSFLAALVRKNYTKIYKRRVIDEMTQRPTQKLGWQNTNPTKLHVTNEFLAGCRSGQIRIRSAELAAQMSTFVQIGSQSGRTLKREALPGCHDDAVVASCLAFEMDRTLGTTSDPSEDWLYRTESKTQFDADTGFAVNSDDNYGI